MEALQMTEPLVSVFIPVYNAEKYIAESLESILNQTYDNLEILLVDDGSTDRSVEIIKSYNDPRIRLIQNEKNMGIPYTRNVGLDHANGKYMAIMDSDDISLPDRIEKQVRFLEGNPDIDVVGTFYYKFNEKSSRKIKLKYTKPEEIEIVLLFYSPISNPSSMVRLDTVKKHNIRYNLNYFVAQDYGFWADLTKFGGKIAVIPEFLLKYRTGHENITKRSNVKKRERRKQVLRSIHKGLLDYIGIHLSDEELAVYSEFYSYNYWTVNDIDLLETTINKLKKWNQTTNHIFDKKLFMKILDHSTLIGVSNQKLSLQEKINLYRNFVSEKNFMDFSYIIMKHFYHHIKN